MNNKTLVGGRTRYVVINTAIGAGCGGGNIQIGMGQSNIRDGCRVWQEVTLAATMTGSCIKGYKSIGGNIYVAIGNAIKCKVKWQSHSGDDIIAGNRYSSC